MPAKLSWTKGQLTRCDAVEHKRKANCIVAWQMHSWIVRSLEWVLSSCSFLLLVSTTHHFNLTFGSTGYLWWGEWETRVQVMTYFNGIITSKVEWMNGVKDKKECFTCRLLVTQSKSSLTTVSLSFKHLFCLTHCGAVLRMELRQSQHASKRIKHLFIVTACLFHVCTIVTLSSMAFVWLGSPIQLLSIRLQHVLQIKVNNTRTAG